MSAPPSPCGRRRSTYKGVQRDPQSPVQHSPSTQQQPKAQNTGRGLKPIQLSARFNTAGDEARLEQERREQQRLREEQQEKKAEQRRSKRERRLTRKAAAAAEAAAADWRAYPFAQKLVARDHSVAEGAVGVFTKAKVQKAEEKLSEVARETTAHDVACALGSIASLSCKFKATFKSMAPPPPVGTVGQLLAAAETVT